MTPFHLAWLCILFSLLSGCEESPIAARAPWQSDPAKNNISPDSDFLVGSGRSTGSGVGGEPLTEKQLADALNLTNWRFPVKVQTGTTEMSCQLDHYLGDRYVATLAVSSVTVPYKTSLPGEFDIAVMIQFPYEYAGRSEAIKHSKEGYFLVSGIDLITPYIKARQRFRNPFFGKGVNSVGGIGSYTLNALLKGKSSRLYQEDPGGPPPLWTPEDQREYNADSDKLSMGMKKNHQLGLMESEDGNNLRFTFDYFPR